PILRYYLTCVCFVRSFHRIHRRTSRRTLFRFNLESYSDNLAIVRYVLHDSVRRTVKVERLSAMLYEFIRLSEIFEHRCSVIVTQESESWYIPRLLFVVTLNR